MSLARPSTVLLAGNVAAYLLLILTNVAAGLGWLGPTNKQLSERYDTPITPAGCVHTTNLTHSNTTTPRWAFSIWGIIFALQGAGIVYAILPHGYSAAESVKLRVVNAVGHWWSFAFLAEVGWQLMFVHDDLLGMWLCLVLLIAALSCMSVALASLYALKDDFGVPSAAVLYSLYCLPTSINTAWLSVATSLGMLVVARAHDVSPASLVVPGMLLAIACTAAGVAVVAVKRDTAYALTLVWALMAVFGRASKQGASPHVRWASFVCLTVMSVATVGSVLRRKAPPRELRLAERDVREPLKATAMVA